MSAFQRTDGLGPSPAGGVDNIQFAGSCKIRLCASLGTPEGWKHYAVGTRLTFDYPLSYV